MRLALRLALASGVAALALAPAAHAQRGTQTIDSAYTARIVELTPTDERWKFTTELVDYLPASSTVPTPLDVLGYVPGTIGKLSHVADINRYFRALDEASPRTRLFSMGKSDEGREMILLAISDEATLAELPRYRAMLDSLADPRLLTPEARERLTRTAKPIYWMTGSIHSTETGSPEMLLELAYRLAVDEGEHVKAIRSGAIVLITPVIETDGRDRQVDVYAQNRRDSTNMSLIYWGKYTAHDNNRDGMVLSQLLTQNVVKTYNEWHPTVFHDLHESVPFLYTSTGTGPYNEQFDAIQVNEWNMLAYQEINELTRRGLPGVWTHRFYDGWTPNYMLSIANFRNGIGRFYETYTSRGADCHTVQLGESNTSREWFRSNPPVNGVRWCIRSNINYQQSAIMVAMRYVAEHPETFLANFVTKGENTIARGRREAPYAFVIPRAQRRSAEAMDLVNLVRRHGSEVHEATAPFTVTTVPPHVERGTQYRMRRDTLQVAAGDWVIRLDQPYTQMPRTLFAHQRFKADDPSPYDDTGWSLNELRHVSVHAIGDSAILGRAMRRLDVDAAIAPTIAGSGDVLLVPHVGDWRSAIVPFRTGNARVSVAREAFDAGGERYEAGTYIIRGGDAAATRAAVTALGLNAVATATAPTVAAHDVKLPRIALMHSWLETQNEGWVRFAFDEMRIPYTYISDQDLRDPRALDRFDAVFFEHVNGRGASLLNGRPMTGKPMPWKKSALTPNLGVLDQTDDVRPGMGLEGAATLRRFVERGGVLIATGNSATLPISLGFNPGVGVTESSTLQAKGAVFRTQAMERRSPILYGYDRATFPVYFSNTPLMTVAGGTGDARPRTILRFHEQADSLLISGQLVAPGELAGRPAVVDAPVGNGHVILFAIRPIWRHGSQGTFALPLNAIVHWNNLAIPTGAVAAEEGGSGL